MIIDNPSIKVDRAKYLNEVLVDTNVLLIYFLSKFCDINEDKKYILKWCHIEQSQIDCLNTIIQNFQLKRLIITPHILAEFLNRIRKDCKADYKEIKRSILQELIEIDEIQVQKNSMLSHKEFIDFGNDISLLLATGEQIKKNKYSTILSFDGRFVNKFFEKTDNILAFNMEVLSYQF